MSTIEERAKENIINKIMLEISFFKDIHLEPDKLELLESMYHKLDSKVFSMSYMRHVTSVIEIHSREAKDVIGYVLTDYDRESMVVFLREIIRASEGLIEVVDILRILERIGYISIIDMDTLIV